MTPPDGHLSTNIPAHPLGSGLLWPRSTSALPQPHLEFWSALQPAKPHSHRVCWKAKQHGPNPMPEGKDLPEKCDVRGSRAQDPALGLNSQRYL